MNNVEMIKNEMVPNQTKIFEGEVVPNDVMAPTDAAVLMLSGNKVSVLGNMNDIYANIREALSNNQPVMLIPETFHEVEKRKNDVVRSCLYASGKNVSVLPESNECNTYTLPSKMNIDARILWEQERNNGNGYFLQLHNHSTPHP